MLFPHLTDQKMPQIIDAYNISSVASIFSSLPRVYLTEQGLLHLRNTTFDHTKPEYLNSLFFTFFASSFVLLFFVFSLYIIFILLIRYARPSSSSTYSSAKCASLSEMSHFHNHRLHAHLKMQAMQQQQKRSRKRQKSRLITGQVMATLIALTATLASICGTILLLQGLWAADSVIEEMNAQSIGAKKTLGTFSRRYLPADPHNRTTGLISGSFSRFLSRFHAIRTMKLYANETTINASRENAQWFRAKFLYSLTAYVSVNILTIIFLTIFWFVFAICRCIHIRPKALLIFSIFCLLLVSVGVSVSLTSGVAMSDFCSKAKPIIADIVVYKVPTNNFTTTFVNYYLHCNLNQWNLDSHKKTILGVLNRVDRAFSSNVFSGIFTNVRNGIEVSYDTLHCSELNRLINQGLSEFCVKPIEGFAFLTSAYSIHLFLFIILLFVITFLI